MSRDIPYYSSEKIDGYGCLWNLIFGERSNGKSYDIKHKKGVLPYFESVKRIVEDSIKDIEIKNVVASIRRFGLVRRTLEEFKQGRAVEYFNDVDFNKISNGKYQGVIIYNGRIYLTKWDEKTLKFKRTNDYIGYTFALNIEQNYAGGSYLDIHDIIFEEFMSRRVYLANEPSKLMSLYATIDRKRGTTRVWLLGNTISQVCPYLKEWGLQEKIAKMKQGEIIVHGVIAKIKDEDQMIKIAVEYCRSTNRSSFTFGEHAGMMNTGEWQSDPQPHLEKNYLDYKSLYKIMFYFKGFLFMGEFLQDKETKNVCWFIHPYKGKIKEKTIVISDEIKNSIYWQRDIYNMSFENERLKQIIDFFRESNIFYSTDLAGTDFKQAIDFNIRR